MTIRPSLITLSFALAAGRAPSALSAQVPSPRSPECETLAARVAAHPDSFQIQAPVLRTIIVPPADHPASAEGLTFQVRMFVDASGAVVGDSTTFSPEAQPPAFRRAFVATVAQYKFRPAMVQGCIVSGVATTSIGFERHH